MILPIPHWIVTGADGFIGTAVLRALTRRDFRVVPVRGPRAASASDGVRRDLAAEGIDDLVSRDDVVLHLAARIPTAFVGEEAEACAARNREIDRRVLAPCVARGAHVVFASSVSVYGVGRWDRPRTENDATDPIGPYARAKLDTEREILARAGGRATVLRISAPYGPGQRMPTVLVRFMRSAAEDRPLLVHGTGGRQQDFIYVDDVADLVVTAGEARAAGVFNVATGRPVTMLELAEAVLRVIPRSASTVGRSGEIDPQEGAAAWYAVGRAATVLGWHSRVGLLDGLRRCVDAAASAEL